MRFDSSFLRQPSSLPRRRAFTLVELLIVIGIIALLIGILIPVIGKVRIAAYETSTRALLTQLDQACQAYYQDFRGYPGIFPNGQLDSAAGVTLTNRAGGNVNLPGTRITGSENLTLSLMGGLVRVPTGNTFTIEYDATTLGQGAVSFNIVRPTRAKPYFEATTLSKGFSDTENAAVPQKAADTVIPEVMDKFPDPMPVIYIRANPGAKSIASADPYDPSAVAQYNLTSVLPYTNSAIGTGRTVKQSAYVNAPYSPMTPHGLRTADSAKSTNKANAGYQFPYDAFDYLTDPASYDRSTAAAPSAADLAKRQPRKKDTYILIFAGRDRVYGTDDDITNFGSVLP